jgi:biotin carboxyl carrier protein
MTLLRFTDSPRVPHTVSRPLGHGNGNGNGHAMVDGIAAPVRSVGRGCFVALVDGRSERLHAVAHGDTVHVQLQGRAWRLERVDPTRSSAADTTAGSGASLAPMPGVVVSLHAEKGQVVRSGDALLVIESMKLQMTIVAEGPGTVAELPLVVGQTFQRGALLVRVHSEEPGT